MGLMEKKEALIVIYGVFKDIGYEQQEIYRKLIVKYKYIQLLENTYPDVLISHSELVDKLLCT